MRSLIERGYFKDNVNFSDTEITKEDTIIKITTVDGVDSYEVLNDVDADNVCSYYRLEKGFDSISTSSASETTETQTGEEGAKAESVISFGSDILTVSRKDDNYVLDLEVTYDFSDIASNFPVYVLMVLDKSGSMADSNNMKFTRSRDASVALSEQVVGINNNSWVGLIQFNNFIYHTYNKKLKLDVGLVPFSRTPLVNGNFGSAGGNTNIIIGLDKALEVMSSTPETALKYVIFLSDGNPAVTAPSEKVVYNTDSLPQSYEYYKTCNGKIKAGSACEKKLYDYRDQFEKMNTNFAIIGYEMSNKAYQKVATLDESGFICPKGFESHCYYEASASNVGDLFSNISNAIIQLATNINNGVVKGKFSDAIEVFDPNTKEKIDGIEIPIDFTKNTYKVTTKYRFLFHVNDVGIECNETSCEFKNDLINELKMDLFNRNSEFLQSLNLSSPKLLIESKKDSYLN